MKIDRKIVDRLDELIATGEKVRSSLRSSEYGGYSFDEALASQWRVSTLNILEKGFGRESVHFQAFNHLTFDFRSVYMAVETGRGILKAAKDDCENGYLFETRTLIEAEVFDDFLEQAQHLFDMGYYQPAAVVAGSVLEDGLRKLCVRKNITLPAKPKLDTMNAELTKAGVYNALTQKNVTALADLRNKAAHGNWDEFSESHVEQMLVQVRSFMENHFT